MNLCTGALFYLTTIAVTPASATPRCVWCVCGVYVCLCVCVWCVCVVCVYVYVVCVCVCLCMCVVCVCVCVAADIAQSVGRLARGWTVRHSNLVGATFHTHPEPPSPLNNGYRDSFPKVRRSGPGVENTPPSAEGKNV